MQATGMVSRTWLTSFFDKDGGKLFREFTVAMRRSSNWDGLQMLSDAELWDSLFSSNPPWSRVSSLPYNDCIISDRWRKFETYRCIFHTDDFSPTIESRAMNDPPTNLHPIWTNYWRGLEVFGGSLDPATGQPINPGTVSSWLTPISYAGMRCIPRNASTYSYHAAGERLLLEPSRTFAHGPNRVLMGKSRVVGGRPHLYDLRSGMRLNGPGFSFIAVDYHCGAADPRDSTWNPELVWTCQEVPREDYPPDVQAKFGARRIGIRASAAVVERFV